MNEINSWNMNMKNNKFDIISMIGSCQRKHNSSYDNSTSHFLSA